MHYYIFSSSCCTKTICLNRLYSQPCTKLDIKYCLRWYNRVCTIFTYISHKHVPLIIYLIFEYKTKCICFIVAIRFFTIYCNFKRKMITTKFSIRVIYKPSKWIMLDLPLIICDNKKLLGNFVKNQHLHNRVCWVNTNRHNSSRVIIKRIVFA